ncbi:MAG: hypothetical protein AAF717_02630 [Bacteroidota bacterium]
MTCKDCNKPIDPELGYYTTKFLGVPLCERHQRLVEKVIEENNTPKEAIQLFYALKDAGANPMLEWWDGQKSVDIAISRVKLNIEIETEYRNITHEQAIHDLEEAMHSFKNGFTTIRIPHLTITHHLDDTVKYILGIIQGLKANLKVI